MLYWSLIYWYNSFVNAVTNVTCGQSNLARTGATERESGIVRQTWPYRVWNGLLTLIFREQIRQDAPRIHNGSPATITEAPFMAHVITSSTKGIKTSSVRCTGSIIGDQWILTAGHCLYPLGFVSKLVTGDAVMRMYRNYFWISQLHQMI